MHYERRVFADDVLQCPCGRRSVIAVVANEDDEPNETEGDGRWMQIGDAMTFSIALHVDRKKDFSRQDGVLTDGTLSGIGSNADGTIWTWTLAPILIRKFQRRRLPVLPDEPRDSSTRPTGKAKHVLPRRRWK